MKIGLKTKKLLRLAIKLIIKLFYIESFYLNDQKQHGFSLLSIGFHLINIVKIG
jgi:hypothetical protein